MTQNQPTLLVSNFLINFSQILGQGATCKVFQGKILEDLGINIHTTDPVAIKAIRMSQINNQVTEYLLSCEKNALSTIKNQYVLKCYDIVQTADFCYIITQLCTNGTLRDYIKAKGKLSSEQAISLFKKILCGYISVIDGLFIHRDLKTANIMLRSNGDPVIIDLGYCETIMGKKPRILYNVGTTSYMSPQACIRHRYSQKSDVWALGVILYQMLTGKTIDDGFNAKQFLNMVQRQGRVNINTSGFDQLTKQLLGMCFQVNHQNRATAHRLKYTIDKYFIRNIKPQTVNLNIKTKQNQTLFSYKNPEEVRSLSETKRIPRSSYQTNQEAPQNKKPSDQSIPVKISFNIQPSPVSLTHLSPNNSLFKSNFSTNNSNYSNQQTKQRINSWVNPAKPIIHYTSPQNSRVDHRVSFQYQDKGINISSPLSPGSVSLFRIAPTIRGRNINFNNMRISAL